MKKTKSLIRQTYNYGETEGTIITDSRKAFDAARLAIEEHRKQLEKYIRQNPIFLYSFDPVHVSEGPLVAKKMAEASEASGVGPMGIIYEEKVGQAGKIPEIIGIKNK